MLYVVNSVVRYSLMRDGLANDTLAPREGIFRGVSISGSRHAAVLLITPEHSEGHTSRRETAGAHGPAKLEHE